MTRFKQIVFAGSGSRNQASGDRSRFSHPEIPSFVSTAATAAFFLAILTGILCPTLAFNDVEVSAILSNKLESSDFPGYPGVIMAHQTSREITGSGAGAYEEHLIGRIFDPVEAESSLGQWSVDLDRNLQFIEVLKARIYRGSETLDLGPEHWGEAPPAGVPEKGYPKRTRFTVRFPEIQSGDFVEIHVKIHITIDPKRFPVVWGVIPLCDELPVVERQIKLSAPVVAKINTKIFNWPGHVTNTYKSTILHYDYHTGHLPALGSPEGMIDATKGPPSFMYTNMESWERVGYILAREFEWATTTASIGIQDSVRAFTKGKNTSRERLLAILDLLDQKVGRVPLPSDLLRYWPRTAAATFAARWADPQDWVCLLSAMCSYAGLPSQVQMITPRADWFREENPNPQQLPHIALKIRLPDEGTNLWIDPLRRPAGLVVPPFPGEFHGLAPIPKNPTVDRGIPIPADLTKLTLEMSWNPVGDSEGWSGFAGINGTGMAAAWIVQNLGGLHSEFDVPLPNGIGWEPVIDPHSPPSVVENWAESSAESKFHWRQTRQIALDDPPAHPLLAFLPNWQGLLENGPSSHLPPEGPITWTTRLEIPSEICPGAGMSDQSESSICGSWKISVIPGDGPTIQYEEVLVWEPGPECTGRMDGLESARRRALGIDG